MDQPAKDFESVSKNENDATVNTPMFEAMILSWGG